MLKYSFIVLFIFTIFSSYVQACQSYSHFKIRDPLVLSWLRINTIYLQGNLTAKSSRAVLYKAMNTEQRSIVNQIMSMNFNVGDN